MKKKSKKKKDHKKVYQLIREKVRKDFISQGGQDGRFATKIVPDKKRKYNRQKVKKVEVRNED
jgi:hypothetical protein